jgi:hypothetical protein
MDDGAIVKYDSDPQLAQRGAHDMPRISQDDDEPPASEAREIVPTK